MFGGLRRCRSGHSRWPGKSVSSGPVTHVSSCPAELLAWVADSFVWLRLEIQRPYRTSNSNIRADPWPIQSPVLAAQQFRRHRLEPANKLGFPGVMRQLGNVVREVAGVGSFDLPVAVGSFRERGSVIEDAGGVGKRTPAVHWRLRLRHMSATR